MASKSTVIVTGASQGIGAAVQVFPDRLSIANAVVFLTEARHVTGEVLHVDGGAHAGRW
jgi:NAD(P)-dependent dehydrogenase (short-subunit alcohol dehydrogenase family)